MNPYYTAIAQRANHRCEYCHAPELLFTEVHFFHPRQDHWSEHFQVDTESGRIMGVTSAGKVTVEYLAMNSSSQVAARQLWIRLGLFP